MGLLFLLKNLTMVTSSLLQVTLTTRNGFCCVTTAKTVGMRPVSDPRSWSFLRVIGSVQLATTSPCSRSLDQNLKSLTSSSRKLRRSEEEKKGSHSSTRVSPRPCQQAVRRRRTRRRKWKSRVNRKHLQATTARTSCFFRDVAGVRLLTTTTRNMTIC